jgi:hypothetical protein
LNAEKATQRGWQLSFECVRAISAAKRAGCGFHSGELSGAERVSDARVVITTLRGKKPLEIRARNACFGRKAKNSEANNLW